MRSALLAVATLLVFGMSAPAQADEPARGQLLYETHCIACHTAQMHWRDQKTATDWASLRAEVRRWQAAATLGWSDDDITEVARHLNQRYYHFAQPAGVVSLAPNAPAVQR